MWCMGCAKCIPTTGPEVVPNGGLPAHAFGGWEFQCACGDSQRNMLWRRLAPTIAPHEHPMRGAHARARAPPGDLKGRLEPCHKPRVLVGPG